MTYAQLQDWWIWPWALSLVFFGLPHGAIDHLIAWQLWPKPKPGGLMLGILAGYASLSGLTWSAWIVVPEFTFICFILLTWLHWGLADLWWSWRRDPTYLRGRGHRWVFTLLRGALPMIVPLLVAPGYYRSLAARTCHLFGSSTSGFAWLQGENVHRLSLAGLTVLLGANWLMADQKSPTYLRNCAEEVGLLLFFGLLPPLLSVGLYFSFWHGLRHVLRLRQAELYSWGRFIQAALPNTSVALVTLLLLALTHTSSSPEKLLALYLSLIAALTVPHAIVVFFQDRQDGLWTSPDARLGSR